MTDKQLAKNIGITTVTLYDWKKHFPEFAEAITEAKSKLRLELEKSMPDLSVGKAYVEDVKIVIDPVSGEVLRLEKTRRLLPPNANLQMFLAKNLMPEKYHPPCWESDDLAETEN